MSVRNYIVLNNSMLILHGIVWVFSEHCKPTEDSEDPLDIK